MVRTILLLLIGWHDMMAEYHQNRIRALLAQVDRLDFSSVTAQLQDVRFRAKQIMREGADDEGS